MTSSVCAVINTHTTADMIQEIDALLYLRMRLCERATLRTTAIMNEWTVMLQMLAPAPTAS